METDSLKGKHILVTAGSTWIPIDTVRVITNIFKGKIGLTIAKTAANMGAKVTLLLGPSLDVSKTEFPSNLHVIRFKYFDELDSLMTENLKINSFDAVIHSAAVSDFKLAKAHVGKIKSDTKKLTLELVPTKKIVDGIKDLAPKAYLVKFKLEVGITPEQLIKVAFKSLKQSNADLIVANIYDPKFTDHEVYIITTDGKSHKVTGKEDIARDILKEVNLRI
jgi:phosphopantothenate-cysteine ligase/phosphopantothenoylcysteine decarboxylase/phosphopantothenate--cysteine ligase